jgi:hypothetical protein
MDAHGPIVRLQSARKRDRHLDADLFPGVTGPNAQAFTQYLVEYFLIELGHAQCIAQCRKLVKALDEKKCTSHAGGDGN